MGDVSIWKLFVHTGIYNISAGPGHLSSLQSVGLQSHPLPIYESTSDQYRRPNTLSSTKTYQNARGTPVTAARAPDRRPAARCDRLRHNHQQGAG